MLVAFIFTILLFFNLPAVVEGWSLWIDLQIRSTGLGLQSPSVQSALMIPCGVRPSSHL